MSDLPSHLGAREREEALRRLDTPSRQRGTSRSYPFAILFVFCTLLLSLGACSKKKVEVKNLEVNPDSLYTARMVALKYAHLGLWAHPLSYDRSRAPYL